MRKEERSCEQSERGGSVMTYHGAFPYFTSFGIFFIHSKIALGISFH